MDAINLKHFGQNSDYHYSREGHNVENQDVTELIEKCIEGDRRAQFALFNRYKSKVAGIVFRSLGPGIDGDDVIQQVFISLFKSLAHFKGLSSFDTWVYRISYKVCTDQLRKKYRKRKLNIVEFDNIEGSVKDEKFSPEMVLQQKELNEKIFSALMKMSIEKRMVVVLYEMEERTVEEIAAIIKKPSGTVKSRLFHGRKELKKHLSRYLDTE
ncbi:MAG: sigma-70 family RNA polymerase sigma factor [Chitinivibrionales bacterium]|nr:sigma-70 family RNA polymerase sigma factor [Chitinivibrionales bacterium]